ncbi:MAG: maleylacetoacetate isomerase [Granulosicoccus sp.]
MSGQDLTLYSYWRSTTAYRVRIALHLKGVAFQTVPVDLAAGEHSEPAYVALNPIKGVPTLVNSDGSVLTQSLAIMDYLDAIAPDPALLPGDAVQRAQVLAAALVIATDIHPVNNLRVLKKLKEMGHTQEECVAWMQHWMAEGLQAFAELIAADTPFCFGSNPAFADICLVAQLYNAHRWSLQLSPFTRLTEIETRCLALPAFQAAYPENQPDVK